MEKKGISVHGMLLRAGEVAQLLGVSTRTVWRLVSAGRLPPPLAIGRSRRWEQADVERFVENLKNQRGDGRKVVVRDGDSFQAQERQESR